MMDIPIETLNTLATFLKIPISIAIFRPFRVGDVVELESEYGTIEDITLWQTDWKIRELTLNRPIALRHIPDILLLRRWFEQEQLF
jgi:hypothetical protein